MLSKLLKTIIEIVKQTLLSHRRSCYICKSNVFPEEFCIPLILRK
ncbi:hypothetical protein RCH33_2340 [Flavobacterium daejeonense]|nr:hypothetical protein RCH33_2340 [Flavobacterium daejeonense]